MNPATLTGRRPVAINVFHLVDSRQLYRKELLEWKSRSGAVGIQAYERIVSWLAEGDAAQVLRLNACSLVDCPPLPDELQHLDLSDNPDLRALLPASVPHTLLCVTASACRLAVLPTAWPPGLQSLLLPNNQIRDFPDALPHSVQRIDLANNLIFEVPHRLPESIETLGLDNNFLNDVPLELLSMPNLKTLHLSSNSFTDNCRQALRQATAQPGYRGPAVILGSRDDGGEVLPFMEGRIGKASHADAVKARILEAAGSRGVIGASVIEQPSAEPGTISDGIQAPCDPRKS